MPSRFFVTGTDTGIGKTVVSALLCASLDAIYWKPIQTGTRDGTDTNTVARLARIGRGRIIPEVYSFVPPVSPHLAAKLAGQRIELRKIQLPAIKASDNLIVEGAGGVLAPINEGQLMADLMKHLRLPALLVSRTTLGTINHTLLSLAVLRAAKVAVRGVIMCGPKNVENRKAIEHYGETEVIGWLPVLRTINRRTLVNAFRKNFNAKAFA